MFQRIRSRRLKRSYMLDCYQFENFDQISDEDDLLQTKLQTCIVISSDEEVQMLVESFSEHHVLDYIKKEDKQEEYSDHGNEIIAEIYVRNKDETFAQLGAQMQAQTKKQTKSVEETIDFSDKKVESISYQDYKLFIMKDIQQQKLEKLKQFDNQARIQEEFNHQNAQRNSIRQQSVYTIEQVSEQKSTKQEDSEDDLRLLKYHMDCLQDKYQKVLQSKSSEVISKVLKQQNPPKHDDSQKFIESQASKSIENQQQKAFAKLDDFQFIDSQIIQELVKSNNDTLQKDITKPQKLNKNKFLKASNTKEKKPLKIKAKEFKEDAVLNVDDLLMTNKIILAALLPPPKYKDDYHDTNLYQEETSQDYDKRQKKNKRLRRLNQKIHTAPCQLIQDRQIEINQDQQILSIIGKRQNQQQQIEYLCTSYNSYRQIWIIQSQLMLDHSELLLSFEKLMQQKLLETKVSCNVPKIREAFTYCLLSHTINKLNITHRIVFIKLEGLNNQEPIKYEKSHEEVSHQEESHQNSDQIYSLPQELVKIKKIKSKKQQKIAKQIIKINKRHIISDEEVDYFEKQFLLNKDMDEIISQKAVQEELKICEINKDLIKFDSSVNNTEQDSKDKTGIKKNKAEKQVEKALPVLSFKQQLRSIRLNKFIGEMKTKQALKFVDHGLTRKFNQL